MLFTFPETTDTIDAIRNAIGRPVEFFSEHKVPCSACSIDPITDTSTNSFCPVCSGVGYVVTFSGVAITGHITHRPSETLQWVTGGQLLDAECRVQIKYNADNLSILQNAKFVTVDNKNYDQFKWMLRGVPEINRILIDCT